MVECNGRKYWRFKYRYAGKEKLLALGVYPGIALRTARQRRDEARQHVAADIGPGGHRRAVKLARVAAAENSFEVVAREWCGKRLPHWAKSHSDKIINRFQNDVFPWIGDRPIAEIAHLNF